MVAIPCPLCSLPMQDKHLAGQTFSQCGSCDGIWIDRMTILQLRGHGLETDPVDCRTPTPLRQRFDQLSCPRCGEPMHVFDYRNSKMTVDQCLSCDHLFLDAGELGCILMHWEETDRNELRDWVVPKNPLVLSKKIKVSMALASALIPLSLLFGFWLVAGFSALFLVYLDWVLTRKCGQTIQKSKTTDREPLEKKRIGKSARSTVPPISKVRGTPADYRDPAPEKQVIHEPEDPFWPKPGR